jgi:hypothetical protein
VTWGFPAAVAPTATNVAQARPAALKQNFISFSPGLNEQFQSELRWAVSVTHKHQFTENYQFCANFQYFYLVAIRQVIPNADSVSTRREEFGLNGDEFASYEALGIINSAIDAMGDDQLKVFASELVRKVRKNAAMDRTLQDEARARIRMMVKRMLRKLG